MSDVIVKLTGSGNWEVPANVSTLKNVLIVAGGGGGGSRQGGGGGAGGVLHLTDVSVTPEDLLAYSVGSGGAGGTGGGRGSDGSDSTFDGNTGVGGGGGGGRSSGTVGNPGGSGGGGASQQQGGTGTAGQGNDGGDANPSLSNSGGGGGGAGAAGSDALDTANQVINEAGDGGDGVDHSSVFGSYGESGWFGGGGGGAHFGNNTPSSGGQGGGADGVASDDGGASIAGNPGTSETGGGGGGSFAGTDDGGDGGSGVILIRYAPTVGNVQATSLGSDSIQVTWDQFTNDDSPPVAADGYEIEIDSGTPIDVGDVQTYTDDELSAETTRSYRVRAYYDGSPTEHTGWSETVQATTDSETLTTIPRSFVITADIKLRDEAPEVSKPPVAVTREYWVIAYRNVAASGFKTWRVFGGELLNGQTFSAPSSQVLGAGLSPDGNWLAYGQTSDPHLVIRSHSEGTLGSNVSVPDRPDDTVQAVRFSYSGNFVAVAHGQSGSSEFASTNLSVYEHSNGTLTYLDSIQLGSNDGNDVAWNEDGDRLIFTEDASWDVYLVGFDGAELTNLDSSNLGRGSSTANYKDEVSFLTGDYAVVGRNTTFELVSVAGDTFSVEQDSVTGARGPNFSSPYLAIGSGTGTTVGRAVYVYKFDGASLTLADEAQAGQNATRAAAISQDTGLVAHVDANNVDILSLIDDELTILDTEAWTTTISGVIIYPGWTP